MIAFTLMENLDEAGYLRIDLDQIADRMDCPLSHVEGVLRHLQGFEPTGIFARDLKECLTLQLAELQVLDGPMMALLDKPRAAGQRGSEQAGEGLPGQPGNPRGARAAAALG